MIRNQKRVSLVFPPVSKLKNESLSSFFISVSLEGIPNPLFTEGRGFLIDTNATFLVPELNFEEFKLAEELEQGMELAFGELLIEISVKLDTFSTLVMSSIGLPSSILIEGAGNISLLSSMLGVGSCPTVRSSWTLSE